LLKVVVGFPNAEEDLAILEGAETRRGVWPAPAASLGNLRAWQTACGAVYCAPRLMQYVTDVVRATRAAADSGDLASGAGPRAGLAILRAAPARAILHGRNYRVPLDVRNVARAAL